MPAHTVVPTTVTISVDWIHIRAAERKAAGAGGRRGVLSPVLLAIQEQTRFAARPAVARRANDRVNGDFTATGVVLIDGDIIPAAQRSGTRRRVLYAPNDALRAYIVAWVKGQPVEPATFTLELPG